MAVCKAKRERTLNRLHGLALAIVASALMAGTAQASWTPEKTTEIVIASGPGSGTDIIGRQIQNILLTGKLVTAPLVVVNKAGGGGGLGLSYLNQHPADGHFLYITSPTLLSR